MTLVAEVQGKTTWVQILPLTFPKCRPPPPRSTCHCVSRQRAGNFLQRYNEGAQKLHPEISRYTQNKDGCMRQTFLEKVGA